MEYRWQLTLGGCPDHLDRTGRALSELLIQSPHTLVMYSSLNHLSTSSIPPPNTIPSNLQDCGSSPKTYKPNSANSDYICSINANRFQWPHWNPGVLRFEQAHLWQCITGAGTQHIGVGLWRFKVCRCIETWLDGIFFVVCCVHFLTLNKMALNQNHEMVSWSGLHHKVKKFRNDTK